MAWVAVFEITRQFGTTARRFRQSMGSHKWFKLRQQHSRVDKEVSSLGKLLYRLLVDRTISSALLVMLVERNPEPQGVREVNPFAVARCDRSDLIELATEIQKADSFVRATACSKLQVIAEQVRFLQQQAQKILLEAKENTSLHHAACNFRKQPGHVYYLYKRPSDQTYFSMLSPDDWGTQGGPPHLYLGSFRLENDMSWTPENKIDEREDAMLLVNKILETNQTFAVTYKHSDVESHKMDSS